MKKVCLGLMLVLAAIMLLGAAQAEVIYSGDIEGGGHWEVDENGVMTISGKVDTEEFEVNGTYLQDEITKVIIGPNVTHLNFGTFSYCYSLTEFVVDSANKNYTSLDGLVYNKAKNTVVVCPTMKEGNLTLPTSVTAIGDDAFVDTHLNSLTLPDGVTTIGSQAFWGCGLTEIRFPRVLEEVASDSFNSNALQRFLVDPNNAYFTAVDGAVYNKYGSILHFYPGGLEGAYAVAAGTEEIASCAFYSAGTTGLTLPEGLHTIGVASFSYSAIQKIDLPATLTSIEEEAFHGCDSLREVNYAGTTAQWANVSVGESNSPLLFRTIHCKNGDIEAQPISGDIGMEEGEVTYTLTPDGLLTVSGVGEWADWVFSGDNNISKAVLESGVTEIGFGAFAWAENLREITIPNSVKEIKYEAFYGCNSLRSITIPTSVKTVGEEVFDACDSLTDIYFGGTMDAWTAMVDRDENEGAYSCVVHCSDGDIEPEGGGDYVPKELFLPEDTRVIEREAFRGVDINTVIINYGCESIGEYAFADLPDLEYVCVPSTVTFIADNAFEGSYDPDEPWELWFDTREGSYAWNYGKAHGFFVDAGE